MVWGFVSLGMAQDEEGSLLLTGIQEVRPPTWLEERLGPKVHGFLYDGEELHPREWSIQDKESRSYLDPQYFEEQMWYISPQGRSGDPAQHAQSIPIRSSDPGVERFSEQGLADPSPIRVNGKLHVFATYRGNIVHLTGEPLQHHVTINGATVPFPVEIDGEVMLLGQKLLSGRRSPVISRDILAPLEPGEHSRKPSWKALLPMDDLRVCASPVLGPDPAGGWILFCVEEL
ncbi:MAG: hypothetical protein P8R54_25170 [Myxococcota bacterium]|nr:hypothetical protein [Myxococcota bacterium]